MGLTESASGIVTLQILTSGGLITIQLR